MPKSKVRKKTKDKTSRERPGSSGKEGACTDRCCPPSFKP
jgi:hypothetical protein